MPQLFFLVPTPSGTQTISENGCDEDLALVLWLDFYPPSSLSSFFVNTWGLLQVVLLFPLLLKPKRRRMPCTWWLPRIIFTWFETCVLSDINGLSEPFLQLSDFSWFYEQQQLFHQLWCSVKSVPIAFMSSEKVCI